MRDNAGFTLIFFLLFSAALSSWMLLLSGTLKRQAAMVSVKNHALRAESEADSLLGESFRSFLESDNFGTSATTLPLSSSPGSLLSLQALAHSGSVSMGKSVLLSVKDFMQPDWTALAAAQRHDFPCTLSQGNPQTSALAFFESGTSCKSASAELDEPYFVDSNLDLNTPLRLRPPATPGSVFRLVVSGSLKLKAPLLINSSNAATAIEIIAFGDVELKSLVNESANADAILIHSSRGKVQIGDSPAASELCQDIPAANLKVTLSSATSIQVGTTNVPAGEYGCGYARDGRFWPKVKVLR